MQPAAGYPVPFPPVPRPGVPHAPQPWLRASDADRDQVVAVLRDAYADGRLDEAEFGSRVDQVLAARTYAELQVPVRDLVRPAGPVAPPRPRPVPHVPASTGSDRFAAMAVHLAGYLALFVIPLIVMLGSRRPSYVHMHATEATNFQLTVLLATAVGFVTGIGVIALPFVWLGWAVLTVAGAIVSLGGGRFRYPLTIRFFS